MAGRECRVLQQIPAPLPPSITSTKPGSACQPPCLHFGQALSTPLEHTAPTWHARSRRRPRFLMFAGVSLQINDSPPSGMEAQAFRRVWKRKPAEPALSVRPCAACDSAPPMLTLSLHDIAGFSGGLQVSGARRRLDGRDISSRSSQCALFDGVHARMARCLVGALCLRSSCEH